MDLDFMKFLRVYGITYREYENLTESEKQELIDMFNSEKIKVAEQKDKKIALIKAGVLSIIFSAIAIFLFFSMGTTAKIIVVIYFTILFFKTFIKMKN